MSEEKEQRAVDYYEVLQVSTNADPEMINRVYRVLARRFHPDNRETGDETRFRAITEAYAVLSDPERRARYDVAHQRQRQERWRLVSAGAQADNDFESEQAARLTVLEVLYTKRRLEPADPGVFLLDLETLSGRPREHLEFTLWFLLQKKYVVWGESSRLLVTAEGVEYLEQNYHAKQQQRRLKSANDGG